MDYFQEMVDKRLNGQHHESPPLDDKNFQEMCSDETKLQLSMHLVCAARHASTMMLTPFASSLIQNLNTNQLPYSQNIQQSIEQNTQNQYPSFQSMVCQTTMQPSILQNWPLYTRESDAINNDDNKNNNNNNNMNNSVKAIEERRNLKRRKGGARPKRQATQPKREAEASVSPSLSVSLSPPITSRVSPDVRKDNRENNREKIFRCTICFRSFGYKHVLQNHERTHTGEKPFKCDVCDKRFTRDHHLKTHIRLHTGEKPYHCKVCNREFVQVANLRRHVRVHTGERPYTCKVCSSKFSDSNQLKSHMLIHQGEKPFQCQYCNIRFRKRHHLANHKCDIQLVNNVQRMQVAQVEKTANSNELLEQMEVFDINGQVKQEMIVKSLEMEQARLAAAIAPRLSIEQLNNPPIPIVGSDAKSEEQPVQTEPEDLSMSTGMHRSQYSTDSIESSVSPSHSHSHSPSSDIIHEENDEKREASLFLGSAKYSRHYVNPNVDRAS